MIGANGNETVLKTFKRTFECTRVGIACGIKKKYKVVCPDIPCAPRPMASTRTHNDEFVERKLIMTRKGCQSRSIYVLFPFRTRSLWAHTQLFNVFSTASFPFSATTVRRGPSESTLKRSVLKLKQNFLLDFLFLLVLVIQNICASQDLHKLRDLNCWRRSTKHYLGGNNRLRFNFDIYLPGWHCEKSSKLNPK